VGQFKSLEIIYLRLVFNNILVFCFHHTHDASLPSYSYFPNYRNFATYRFGDEIKGDEMGAVCSTYEGLEMHAMFSRKTRKEKAT